MNNKFKIGIIGAGSISDIHCTAIKKTGFGELYCVFDTNKSSSEKLKEQFNELKIYDSFEKFMLDKEIDIFVILVPPKKHFKIIINILKNTNKPIFCEKPLVLDDKELSTILKMENKNKRLFVGQNYRYFGQIIKTKGYFEKNKNDLKYFEIKFRKHIYKIRPLNGWRSKYENYIVVDNGMHIIDLLIYLTGRKIVKVNCQTASISNVINGADLGTMNIELEGGVKGIVILDHDNIISNTLYEGKHYYRFGNKTLTLDESGLIEYIDNKKEVIKKNILIDPPITEDWLSSFVEMWDSFFLSIEKNRDMEISPDNIKSSLYGVLMAVNSAKKEKSMEKKYGEEE